MTRNRTLAALALGALALGPAGCSPDASPTAPAAPAAPIAAQGVPAAAPAADLLGLGSTLGQVVQVAGNVTFGLLDAVLLNCEPMPITRVSKRIGPNGGELRVGPHKLTVPAGALATEVEISGAAVSGSRREVEFAPHGLTFAKQVRLTMTYDRCAVPSGTTLGIVYTGQDGRILATQPSVTLSSVKQVEGWTDHFSGYAVAYGRR
jgi:hypothetical protein